LLTGLYSEDTKTIVVSATCGGGMIKMSQSGPANTTSGKFYIMEDGRIMGARGHMHGKFSNPILNIMRANIPPDGATAMHMYINDKFICSSEAQYGYGREAPMGGSKPDGGMSEMSHGHSRRLFPAPPNSIFKTKRDEPPKDKGILTIASMTDCEGPWKVKKGDFVKLVGEYDLKKHPL
jgi:hypothetical protein